MQVTKRTGVWLRLVRTLAAAVVMTALPGFLSSCATSGADRGVSNARVITLNNIDTLKSVFDRDDGHTRLILIFSPT